MVLYALLPELFFMEWINKIDRIVVLNLSHREDRLIFITEQFEKYSIPFDRVEAIYNEQQGAQGLRDTVCKLFREELEKGSEHILVFEDDCKLITSETDFHETMNKVMSQRPEKYHMIYLGGQMSHRITRFHSENLIPVQKYFATHAVMYSRDAMQQMVESMGFPIDNWAVDNIQIMGFCYAIHPILASQIKGYSDIGKNEIDWHPFIVPRHEQRINEYRAR